MIELISGKEAKLAWANGLEVQWKWSFDWDDLGATNVLGIFENNDIKFRLKPSTITINGIEVPAPFKPKEGDVYWHTFPVRECGYKSKVYQEEFNSTQFGAWRTEEEIKQVVAALRSIFNAT